MFPPNPTPNSFPYTTAENAYTTSPPPPTTTTTTTTNTSSTSTTSITSQTSNASSVSTTSNVPFPPQQSQYYQQQSYQPQLPPQNIQPSSSSVSNLPPRMSTTYRTTSSTLSANPSDLSPSVPFVSSSTPAKRRVLYPAPTTTINSSTTTTAPSYMDPNNLSYSPNNPSPSFPQQQQQHQRPQQPNGHQPLAFIPAANDPLSVLDPFPTLPHATTSSSSTSLLSQQQLQQQQQQQQQQIQQQTPLISPQPNTPMPLYPKAMFSSTASLSSSTDSLANSFSHLGLNTPIMPPSTVPMISLIGAPPAPHQVHDPPPAIRLSQQASCTPSPYANCSISFQRSTLNVVPQSAALLSKVKIPLALYIAPFRDPEPNEPAIPVINTSTIVRCRRCRTYINPYVQFLDKGHRWKCNLCYFPNDVPESFDFDPIQQTYVDRWQRPELNHAVVEFVAPSEYMLRPPQPATFLFVLDVSMASVASGMVATVCQALKAYLETIPNIDQRTLVGLITVDSAVHYYQLDVDPIQILVMSDLEDVFLPLPEGLFVNLAECKAQIHQLLDLLPTFHGHVNVFYLKPALQAAHQVMQSIGGKIVVFMASSTHSSSAKPKALPFYKQFAVDCSRCQISVDLFLFYVHRNTFPDLPAMVSVAKFTAGNVYTYPDFSSSSMAHVEKVHQEIRMYLSRGLGLEAVMRVRASRGLRMSVYHGHFFVRSTDLLALPNVHPNNTYCIEVAIDEPLQTAVVCFQTALLHTTAFGERRIRVLTLALPVSQNLSDILPSIDTGSLMVCLTRKAMDRVLESSAKDSREAVTNKCVDVLANQPGLSLTCPTNLKLFPLFCLGLIKHPVLRNGTPEQQCLAMAQLNTCCIETLLTQLHPFLYPLHTEQGGVLPVSSERLERDGIYLVSTGVELCLWISRQANVSDLFPNVPENGPCILPTLDTPFSLRTRDLIHQLRQRSLALNTVWPLLYVIKEDSDIDLRNKVLHAFIEDRVEHGPSYPQFLAMLREKVAARGH